MGFAITASDSEADDSYDPLCISPLPRGRRGGGGGVFLMPAQREAEYA